jgi:tetratricopeptide (TPR) repeat protein
MIHETKPLPRELIKAASEKKLVIFVGAGLSWDLENRDGKKIEGWNNFVKELLDHLENEGFDVGYLKGLIGKHEPIDILRLIEKINGAKNETIAFAKRFYSLKDSNDHDLHKKLFEIANNVITTNYDNAFEKAKIESLNIASVEKPYELSQLLDNRQGKNLLQLHGSISNGETMVILPSDYDELYNRSSEDAERIIFHLQNMIVNNTILFVGCSMGDFQIKNIFSDIKRVLGKFSKRKHFIIMKKDEFNNTLLDLELIKINDYSEIKDNIDTILVEKEKLKNQKEKELEALLAKLYKSKISKLSIELTEKGKECYLDKNYDKAADRCDIAIKIDPNNAVAFNLLGLALCELAELNNDGNLYNKAIEKYERATELDPNFASAFRNWGNALCELAELNNDGNFYNEAVEKYEKATELNPNNAFAFNLWGFALCGLAKLNNDGNLYNIAIEKYKQAIELDPNNALVFNGWGNALFDLAKLNNDGNLYSEAIKKYERATELNLNDALAFHGWGLALCGLAKLNNDGNLYNEAIRKYERATELDSNNALAFNRCGNVLFDLAVQQNDVHLCYKAVEKYEKATELNPNDALAFHGWGFALYILSALNNDGNLCSEAIKKYERASLLDSNNVNVFYNWGNALYRLAELNNDGNLYSEAIKKYERAIELDPYFASAFDRCGNAFFELAILKNDIHLCYEAIEKYKKATELDPNDTSAFNNWGIALYDLANISQDDNFHENFKEYVSTYNKIKNAPSYPLARIYAFLKDKKNALYYLEKSLENKQIDIGFVLRDKAWVAYSDDEEFQSLMSKYK